MTFDDIMTRISFKVNISSVAAQSRIATFINDRYQQIMSAVGLDTIGGFTIVTTTTVASQHVVFTGITNLVRVLDPAFDPVRVLTQIPYKMLRRTTNSTPATTMPTTYAVHSTDDDSVDIILPTFPPIGQTLWGEGQAPLGELLTVDIPQFPSQFHDLLIEGPMAWEMEHQEKYQQAAFHEARYEKRLSELRLFLADSDYKSLRQGVLSEGIWTPNTLATLP